MILCVMILWSLNVGIGMGHKLPLQEEGACFSMFNYEYKVVQKLVQLEESQEKNVQKIQVQQEQLAAANERQEKIAQTLQLQNDTLQLQNDMLAAADKRQKATIQTMQTQREQHQQKMTETLQSHKEQIAAVDERLETMKQLLETQSEQTTKLASNLGGKQVAFSVYQLKSTLTSDNAPVFSVTAVNTGSFDRSSSRFTCPIAGQYFFTFSLEHSSGTSGSGYCLFHVNGAGSVYVAARTGPYDMASGSVIYHLAVNDIVSLSCHGWQYVRTATNNAVFSGFLISQD